MAQNEVEKARAPREEAAEPLARVWWATQELRIAVNKSQAL